VELVKAIDQLDQHVFAAPDVPLTQQVRLERSLLRASMSVIRIRADERFGTE
jgi:hypothetical protein